MDELMSVPLAGGGELLVEVSERQPGTARATRVGEVVQGAVMSLTEALEPMRKAAEEARDALAAARPDELEVEFGVKLSAEGRAFVAKAGLEGHLQVKMVWKPGDRRGSSAVEAG